MAEPAANDFAAIRATLMRLKFERHGCNLRKGLKAMECWCYHAGSNGTTLPCPPPPEVVAEYDYCCWHGRILERLP
jgi:hypothetical protein